MYMRILRFYSIVLFSIIMFSGPNGIDVPLPFSYSENSYFTGNASNQFANSFDATLIPLPIFSWTSGLIGSRVLFKYKSFDSGTL